MSCARGYGVAVAPLAAPLKPLKLLKPLEPFEPLKPLEPFKPLSPLPFGLIVRMYWFSVWGRFDKMGAGILVNSVVILI